MLTSWLQDLRYSVRSLSRSPTLTCALLFTIALGIGANSVIHGLTRGLVRGRVAHLDTERVVSIFASISSPGASDQLPYNEYVSLKNRADAFEWVGAAQVSRRAVVLDDRSVIMTVAAVTPEIGRLLGLPLGEGIVLSHAVEGRVKSVRIDDAELHVDGIAPATVSGLYVDRPVDAWIALRKNTAAKLWVIAKLRPGGNLTVECCDVVPYTGLTPKSSSGLERVTMLLQFAAALVLLIACANVASFQLGRAASRSQETSIQVALGAGPARLTRALFTDSLVIAVSGGVLGVLLAIWTSRIVPALLFADDAEVLVQVPDAATIMLWSMAALGMVVACGLMPVIETPHARPADVLRRESSRGSKRGRTVRTVLVIGQMSCCCVLIVSTAYLHDGLRAALKTSVSRGLGPVILATVQADANVGSRYFRDIERAATDMPGVSVRGWTTRLPGNQPAWQSFRVEPKQYSTRELALEVGQFNQGLLDQVRLPPVAGRLFGLADQVCRVAVADEQAATALFGRETVGRVVYDGARRPVVLIGIIGFRNSASPSKPTIYFDHTRSSESAGPSTTSVRFRTSTQTELEQVELNTNVVSPEYFASSGFAMLAGQTLAQGKGDHCRVAVVNREAAELYFRGDAVGGAVIDESGRRTEIIGVVNASQLGALQQGEEPAVYFPMQQDAQPRMTVLLSVPSAADAAVANVHRILDAVPGRSPVGPMVVRSLEAYLNETGLAQPRIAAAMLTASALTALLLAGFGLYGMLSDTAKRQRRDIAIRIALGARPRDVIGWVLSRGAKLAVAGTISGLAASAAMTRILSRVAMTGDAPAAWVWMAGPVLLAGVVGVASILPARRSLMVDPVRTLREE